MLLSLTGFASARNFSWKEQNLRLFLQVLLNTLKPTETSLAESAGRADVGLQREFLRVDLAGCAELAG